MISEYRSNENRIDIFLLQAPVSKTRFKQSFGSHVSAIRWKKQPTNPTEYKPLMGSFVAGKTMK